MESRSVGAEDQFTRGKSSGDELHNNTNILNTSELKKG